MGNVFEKKNNKCIHHTNQQMVFDTLLNNNLFYILKID